MRFPSRLSLPMLLLLSAAVRATPLWAAPAATTTTLAITASGSPTASIPNGTAVTLTATVSSGSVVHPGQVAFCDATAAFCSDIHLLGVSQLTAAGTATLKYVPGPGLHSYKAVFLGTSSGASSASAVSSLSVTSNGGASTTSVLTATGTPGNYTLSDTVTGTGLYAPSGTIAFVDTSNSDYLLASASLSVGASSLNFAISSTLSTPSSSEAIAEADFDGDGIPDLAVIGLSSSSVQFLHGNGDGSFTTRSSFTLNGNANMILTADFNGDGIPDLAVTTNSATASLQILLGNGDGTFTAAALPNVSYGSLALATGDFNNDGNPDLIVAGLSANTLKVLLGNGDGSFVSPTLITIDSPSSIAVGDFNSDGNIDLAVSSFNPGYVTILLGNGSGSFTAEPATLAAGGTQTTQVVAADFNHDGHLDLGVTSLITNTLKTFLGKGDGTFAASQTLSTGLLPFNLSLGDFNSDGVPDLIAVNFGANSMTLELGNGDGTFTAFTSLLPTGSAPEGPAIADFNGDGIPDIAVTNGHDSTVDILLTHWTGKSTATVTGVSPVGTGAHYAQGSYNGDVSNASSVSNLVPLQAQPVATTPTLTASPNPSPFGAGVNLAAAITPSSASDHVLSGSVTFYDNGTSLGSAPVANAVASLVSSTIPAGASSLTCVYSGDTNFATSACAAVPISITAGISAQTITFPPPSNAYAQTSIALNATSSANLPITYKIISGAATINGSILTFTNPGTVVVEADQSGDAGITAATPVQQTIAVTNLTEPVNTASPSLATLLTFTTAGTLNNISVLTQGSPGLDFAAAAGTTCTVGTTYISGQSCLVSFTFDPLHPGSRYGGITLTDASGTVLASSYLLGIGNGPQAQFLPATQTILGGSFNAPLGIALDGNKDVFVSTPSLGAINEILATGGYATTTPVATANGNLKSPYQVATDGNGNLFVVEDGTNIVKEIFAAGGYTRVVTLAPGNSQIVHPQGVAVDRFGNVFVGCDITTPGYSNSVYELTAAGGYATVTQVANGFFAPHALAVDSSGDVFVADFDMAVREIVAVNGTIPASPTVRTISVNINVMSTDVVNGIAVDGVGNLFVVDSYAYPPGDGLVYEIPVAGNYTTGFLVARGFLFPQGIIVDGSGNLYLADSTHNQVVRLDLSDPPTLNFATTKVGFVSSDSPQTVTLTNNGNAPLIFPSPSLAPNPSITPGFQLVSLAPTGDCPVLPPAETATASLAPGSSCTDSVEFYPVTPGNITGQLVITDNHLNVANAQQIIPLNGTATGNALLATTSTLTALPNPTTYAVPVHLSVTVAPAASSASVPGGSVTFYDNGNYAGFSNLTNGSGSFVNGTLPLGTSTLTCTYSGDSVFATSTCAPVSITINPALATQTITLLMPSTAYAQTSYPLGAVATSNLPVSFRLISGPALLSGSTLTYTGPGTVVIEADQPGNASYSAAPPVQWTVAVSTLTEPVHVAIPPLVPTLVTFTSAGTLSNVAALTQGASNLDFTVVPGGNVCTIGTMYSVGQTCLVHFSFNPTRPGARYGGLTLTDASGNLLASSHIFGIGTGPQVAFSPAQQITLTTNLVKPYGIAILPNGDVFVADSTSGQVKLFSSSSGYQTYTVVGSGFTDPIGVAIDGVGNLFVADHGGNTVDEVLATGGYSTVLQRGSGFAQPQSIAVDANGNVFIAENLSSTVQELLAATDYASVVTLPGIYPDPEGIALDSSGNLFVVGTNHIQEISASSGYTTVTALPGTFPSLFGIAIDANADIYVTDRVAAGITSSVEEIIATDGYTTVVPIAAITNAFGLALNGFGDIFVSSYSQHSITRLAYSIPPTLTFATTPVDTTSSDSPQTVTLLNIGNAPVTFPSLTSSTNPAITAGFQLISTSSANDCPVLPTGGSISATLAAGASCTDTVQFHPATAGTYTGTLTHTDNNLNLTGSTQVIPLNATATALPTTATLTVSPNPAIQDAAVTLTATIASPVANPVAPTGYVTFFVNGTTLGEFPVANSIASYTGTTFPVGTDAITCTYSGDTLYSPSTCNTVPLVVTAKIATTTTAAVAPEPSLYGQPTIFTTHVSAVSGTAIPTGLVVFTFCHGATTTVTLDASGNASFITPTGTEISEPAGSCPFTAQYQGDANFAASTSAPVAYIVLPAPSTTSLTASPNPGYLQQPITLTATVKGVASPTLGPGGQIIPPGIQTPTGSVNFFSNGTLIGSAPIINGVAAFLTTSLAVGTDTILAVYPGDNNLTGSSSSTVSEVILLPDFTLTAAPSSLTLVTGHRSSITLTLASISGWTGPITITCPNLPAFASCTAPTVFLPANGTLTATFGLDTSGSPRFYGANHPPAPSANAERLTLASLACLSLLLLPITRKRLRSKLLQSTLTLALLTLATTALTSCANTYPDFTPPGTYTIPITATGTSANLTIPTTHTLNVTLVVTQ